MSPIVWRPPTLFLPVGTDPVAPGGDRAGWVSGSLEVRGGARFGSGFIAGAITIAAGSIDAVAPPVNGGSGYQKSAEFEVDVVGDGTGAIVVAVTNSSGAVTNFRVISRGYGYTNAAIGQIDATNARLKFDLGPDWHQYSQLVFQFRAGHTVSKIEWCVIRMFESLGFSGDGLICLRAGDYSEAQYQGLSWMGNPSFGFRSPGRFICVDFLAAVTVSSNVRAWIGMYSA